MVQDVRVNGVPATGDNRVSVKLTYTGNGASPSVTVVANNMIRQRWTMMHASGHGRHHMT